MWQKDDIALGAEYQYVVNSIQQSHRLQIALCNKLLYLQCSCHCLWIGCRYCSYVDGTNMLSFMGADAGGGGTGGRVPRSKILRGTSPQKSRFLPIFV